VILFIYRDEVYNPDTATRAWPRSSSPNSATARPVASICVSAESSRALTILRRRLARHGASF